MNTEYMSVFSGYVLLFFLSVLNMAMYGAVGFVSGLLSEGLNNFMKRFSHLAFFQERKGYLFYSIVLNAIVFIGMLILFEFVILYLLYGINIFQPQVIF